MKKEIGIERIKVISEIYKDNTMLDFQTHENDTIFSLDIDKNEIHYTYTFLEECGCCDRTEEDYDDLDIYLGYMSESEFNEFVEHIKEIKK
jgi:hypothetical protein